MEGRNGFFNDNTLPRSFEDESDANSPIFETTENHQKMEISSEEVDRMDNNDGTTYLRKPRLTRTSSEIIIQQDPNEPPTIFQRVTKLGQGSFASVSKFSDKEHDIAIKKPRKNRTACRTLEEQAKLMSEAEIELYFLRKAYPNDGPYSLYRFDEANPDQHSPHPYLADWRIIQPFIPGITLLALIEREVDPDLLAIIIFNTAIELQRIHDAGVIHGDVSIRNIIVTPDLSIRFVDFAFAYETIAQATTVNIDAKAPCYIAPERTNTKICAAHPAQDIYSLAYLFEILVNHYQSLPKKLEFYHKFDCIIEFIACGLKQNPNERKSIAHLLEELNNLLMVGKVKTFLNDDKNIDLKNILNVFSSRYPEKEALRILFDLCNDQEYRSAQNLLDHLVDVTPLNESNAALEVISMIIELGKKLKKFTGGFYNESTRKHMIDYMLIANELMDLIIHHPGTPCSQALAERMLSTPIFGEIYNNLCQQGYLPSQPSSSICNIQ